jgi:hypothetical protein
MERPVTESTQAEAGEPVMVLPAYIDYPMPPPRPFEIPTDLERLTRALRAFDGKTRTRTETDPARDTGRMEPGTVTVTWNGTDKQLPLTGGTKTIELLRAAIHAHQPDADTTRCEAQLGLFTDSGVELDDLALTAELGVRTGDLLVLRPRVLH